jgi:K(+)-stimulated pyrophosphate-energized sodium pump
MGADIFESYVGAIIAAMVIAFTMTPDEVNKSYLGVDKGMLLALPLLIAVTGLAASLIGILSMNFLKRFRPRVAFGVAEALALVLVLGSLGGYLFNIASNMNVFFAILAGGLCGFIIGKLIGYYTSSRPMREIVEASATGASTNIIAGFADYDWRSL